MHKVTIVDTDIENISQYGVCGYKNSKTPGFNEKISWLKERYQEGLKIKVLYSEAHGTQGMIEYIPGDYCWRPVDARDFMFIHCVFTGFKKEYKGKGYASELIEECEKDARQKEMSGVAVVTRKGPFMVGREIFIKKGYAITDRALPDFELLVKRFDSRAKDPKFRDNTKKLTALYDKGLTLIRADQCPYTVKNIQEIREAAEKQFDLKPVVIAWRNHEEAQGSPMIFGTFGILYNGKVIAGHPISRTRFVNIMNGLLGETNP